MDLYTMSSLIFDFAIIVAMLFVQIIILYRKKHKNSLLLLLGFIDVFLYFSLSLVLRIVLSPEIRFILWKITNVLLMLPIPLAAVFARRNSLGTKYLPVVNGLFFLEAIGMGVVLFLFIPFPEGSNIYFLTRRGILSLSYLNMHPLLIGHFAYQVLLMFYSIFNLFRNYSNMNRPIKMRNIAISISFFIPFTGFLLDLQRAEQLGFFMLTPYTIALELFLIFIVVTLSRTFQVPSVGYSTIIENMHDGLIVLDDLRKVIEINPRAQNILQCPIDWTLGKPLIQLSEKLDTLTRETSDPTPGELVLPDGEEKRVFRISFSPLLPEEEIPGTLIFLRDITNTTQITQKLRQSRENYTTVFQQATDAILMGDDRQNIIEANPSSSRLLGYTSKEYTRLNMSDLLNEESPRMNLIESPDYSNSKFFEAVFQHKDGRSIPVELSVTRLPDAGCSQYLYIIRDITLRKVYENTIETKKKIAEEANKAKTTFLANMSHELRTPLNAIIGMTSILKNTPLEENQKDYLNTIQASSDTLLNLLNDILDISRIEANKIELEQKSFLLRDCIDSAMEIVLPHILDKKIEIGYTLAEGIPEVYIGDSYRLRQVILNLLNNAIKFTREGEISLHCLAKKNEDNKMELEFIIDDDGIGIPLESRKKIFNSFNQGDSSTTRRFGGSGLGLTICREICDMMDGKIWLSDKKRRGSRFHFTVKLPLDPQRKLPDYLIDKPASVQGKTALILTQSTITGESLTSNLSKMGLRTRTISRLPRKEKLSTPCEFLLIEKTLWNPEDPLLEDPSFSNARIILLDYFPRLEQEGEESSLQLSKPVKVSDLFRFITKAPEAVSLRGKKKLPKLDTEGISILLAEDNKTNQKVEMILLRKLGYAPDLAADGNQVIRRIQSHPYNIILMDDHMPGKDGVATTQWIRENIPEERQPYIIALTANALLNNKDHYLQAGMDDYISKPIDLEKLITALKTANRQSPAARILQTKMTELEELIGSKEELKELLNDFFEDSEKLITNMEKAEQEKNQPKLQMLAHTLKSTSLQMGGVSLSEACRLLEVKAGKEMAQSGETARIKALSLRLKAKIENYLAEIGKAR